MISPRFRGEPVSLNTNRGRANNVKELPRLEMVCPTQNRQKSPPRRRTGACAGSDATLHLPRHGQENTSFCRSTNAGANEDRVTSALDETTLARQTHEAWERKAAFWDEAMGEGNAFQRI